MNLPIGGNEYLIDAINSLKNVGMIHYHQMVNNEDLNGFRKWLESTVTKHGFRLKRCMEHNLGSYSAFIYHYCYDLLLEKN